MTKAKKVLSLVLAVVMVAATFAFSASAANEKNATFTVSVDKATVSQGEEITVTVNLTTNYYAGPTNVPVYYNHAVFAFVEGSVTGAKIFGEGATDVQSHNDADTGCLKVAFIPNTADGTAAAKVMNGENLFTFKLRAIANGTSDIYLKAEDQKTATNIGGTLYCGAYDSDQIDNNPATVGQTFVINKTSATVGATATPELQLSEYGAEIGAVISRNYCTSDTDSEGNTFAGCVMGIDTLGVYSMDTLSDCLTTPAGSITINTDATVGGCETTGAVIELRDDNGDIVERYVFIYFGDVDTDGAIMGGDGVIITDYEATYEGLESEYLLLAADIDGDTAVMGGDGIILMDYESSYDPESALYPTQATLAQLYA